MPVSASNQPASQAASSSGQIQAVSVALRLLETVAEEEGQGMSALAVKAGLTHNHAHRLLLTLEGNGYVVRDADRSYHLGPKLALLNQRANRYRALIEAAKEPMDWLSALSGESILLAVRGGLERVVIDRRTSTHSLRVDWALGSRLPLHVGGLGVALLAFAPEGVLESVLKRERQRYTKGTLTTAAALKLELDRVRKTGLRVSVDDYAVGEFSVAAPVLNAQGVAVAALNIAGFTARLTAEKRVSYGEAIKRATSETAVALKTAHVAASEKAAP